MGLFLFEMLIILGIIVDVGWEYVAFGQRKSHHQAGQGQVAALLLAAQLRD